MRVVLWWTSFCTLVGICCLHFACILLFNLPINPIIVGRGQLLNGYIKPYFQQTWDFFAPSPNDRNYFILARAVYAGPSNNSLVTQWYNISEVLLEPVKANRLSPLFQVELGLANASEDYVNYLGSVPSLSHDDHGQSVLNTDLPGGLVPVTSEYISRTSAATLMRLHPELRFQKLQTAIFVNRFPAFTKRTDFYDESAGSLSSTPWITFPTVSPF